MKTKRIITGGLSAALLGCALLSACTTGQTPTTGPQLPAGPSAQPSSAPSAAPTAAPSAAPSEAPSSAPSAEPSDPVPDQTPIPPKASPELLDNLTGVWNGGSSGKYYLRQSGDVVLWYGESKATAPEWAQVAVGHRNSENRLEMEWYDVPKGESSGRGTLEAALLPDERLSEKSHTGPLNESEWELHDPAPSYPLVVENHLMPVAPPTDNFTGVWKDLQGARYYLRQSNARIVGYAESSPSNPAWSALIYGSVSGNKLSLRWAGLPKSTQPSFSLSSGAQRMYSANANVLMVESGETADFGMSKWYRDN